jgi:putative membrane-bound dehydrogenase-like protein
MRFLCFFAAISFSIFNADELSATEEKADTYTVGVAQVDITPSYPIRLNGFGFRRTESEGVTQRIWAKALVIGGDEERPAVLIAVDLLGVPSSLIDELGARLEKKTKLRRERLTVTATHTHTAPMIRGVSPTIFGMPIPKEHQGHIDRYTAEFTDKLEQVALAALADRKPAKLFWGVGKVGFAMNRRTKGGPVDHDLPLLVVKDPAGKVRAIYASYACHCVTLSNNKISGDWAGFAQQSMQDDYPGAIALVSVGCGADANPNSGVTGDKVEIARRQGAEVAAEVKRLLGGYLAPIHGKLGIDSRRLELQLAKLPTREEWEAKAKRKDAIGYHAQVNLARLDRGEALPTKIEYRVQAWTFGDSLAMLFLPGEVVVDYSLRIKKELDRSRLWINAYSNDAPCYIPSEHILKEGGYEGGGAMVYYDVPVPFAPGLEEPIVRAAHDLLGKRFARAFDADKTQGSLPLSPQQSCATIQTKSGLVVELVAAEPLVQSPVAIAFGPDGKLWVAEMSDYPTGKNGKYQPGGRIRVLEDTDGDGIYDKSNVFLDNIPFPTGVTAWRKGVLICAAPDILYAEDTTGSGKADLVKKLYSGFGTDNYQARVNSLEYGLDGWIYGSCGMFGGQILSHRTGKTLALGNRDFRIKPDTGEIEPATGRTQQGRVRDDWGNWFGCDNSNLCWHYPLPDHYLRRNPHVAAPPAAVPVSAEQDPNRLFPANNNLQLFKLSGPPGRTTSACGIGVYRDDLLGKEYQGNVFTCEPVNLLIHRLVLSPKGSTFAGHRAPDEQDREFLAATDTWFRPVQVRTGPDGALYVVDMYRFVIEHPRWIPPEDLKRLDVRAGATMGRIYRIRPANRPLRKVPRLDQLDAAALVAALDTPNGTVRDLATQMLAWKPEAQAREARPQLEKLAANAIRPQTRVGALSVLDDLGTLRPPLVQTALTDPHAGVRRHAARLAEVLLRDGSQGFVDRLLFPYREADDQARLQRALALGECRSTSAGIALGMILLEDPEDPYLQTAVLSSVNERNLSGFARFLLEGRTRRVTPVFLQQILRVVAAIGDKETVKSALDAATTPVENRYAAWQFRATAGLLDAASREDARITAEALNDARSDLTKMYESARLVVNDGAAKEATRVAAMQLLGRDPERIADDADRLAKLLVPQNSSALQAAAVNAIARFGGDRAAAALLGGWRGFTPALRSQVVEVLLSRNVGQRQLLNSIENKTVPAADIDARHRQRLLTHKDESIRALAAKLFAGSSNPDRQKVLAAYQDVTTLKGERIHGKAVFTKSCSTCHRLQDVGHAVGPDLASVATKTPHYLLQEMLDPNLNVDSRYIDYAAVTKSGRTFTGILASESATSITLRGQEGKEQVLLRSELDELSSTGKSLMPEGLEKDLSKQDLADVIAYLTANSPPPKQLAGNTPAVVKTVNGELTLLATNCEIYGSAITFESDFRNIGMWHGVDDHVVWSVQVERAGVYQVFLDYACDNSSAGNAYVLEGGRNPLRGTVAGTGGWDKYRKEKIGKVTLTAGQQRFVFRPDGKPSGALLDLRGIQLIPSPDSR